MSDQLNLVFAIHRMTHEIAVALERAELGVNQPEAHVLAYLAERGDASVADIHRTFGHKRSTLTSILDRLEARGLIERAINGADRRSFLVKLTDRGRPIAGQVQNWIRHMEADVIGQLTQPQLRAFDALNAAVRHAANRVPSPAGSP